MSFLYTVREQVLTSLELTNDVEKKLRPITDEKPK